MKIRGIFIFGSSCCLAALVDSIPIQQPSQPFDTLQRRDDRQLIPPTLPFDSPSPMNHLPLDGRAKRQVPKLPDQALSTAVTPLSSSTLAPSTSTLPPFTESIPVAIPAGVSLRFPTLFLTIRGQSPAVTMSWSSTSSYNTSSTLPQPPSATTTVSQEQQQQRLIPSFQNITLAYLACQMLPSPIRLSELTTDTQNSALEFFTDIHCQEFLFGVAGSQLEVVKPLSRGSKDGNHHDEGNNNNVDNDDSDDKDMMEGENNRNDNNNKEDDLQQRSAPSSSSDSSSSSSSSESPLLHQSILDSLIVSVQWKGTVSDTERDWLWTNSQDSVVKIPPARSQRPVREGGHQHHHHQDHNDDDSDDTDPDQENTDISTQDQNQQSSSEQQQQQQQQQQQSQAQQEQGAFTWSPFVTQNLQPPIGTVVNSTTFNTLTTNKTITKTTLATTTNNSTNSTSAPPTENNNNNNNVGAPTTLDAKQQSSQILSAGLIAGLILILGSVLTAVYYRKRRRQWYEEDSDL